MSAIIVFPRKTLKARSLSTLLVVAASMIVLAPRPASASPLSSANVAYVFDDALFPCGSAACGMNDTGGPGVGASVFVNALTGSAPGSGNTGLYTTANGTNQSISLTNVPLSELNGNPAVLMSFDTAIVYATCAIGVSTNATAIGGINAFLNAGKKVIIMDADACSNVAKGAADWSNFLFPFTTNSPGPQGASGTYDSVEPSTLTAGLSAGPQPGDAVGDANVFTTFSGDWFKSIVATNLNTTGIVEAYARSGGGGLAIYEGEDFWFTFGPSPHLRLVFDDMVNQTWDPDNLPGTSAASGVTLSPASQTAATATSAQITATVTDAAGNPSLGVIVSFSAVSGPDQGSAAQTPTDSQGQAVFTLFSRGTSGTDTVQAAFTDGSGNVHNSNAVTVVFSTLHPTLYAALGDSYSSGEGNPPFQTGTDLPGFDTCHRSETQAFPELMASDLGVSGSKFSFVACSPATTGNVTYTASNPTTNPPIDQPTPEAPQIQALSSNTKVVTLSIGGDDIDFSDILSFCVIFACPVASHFSDVLQHVTVNIRNLEPKLVATYQAIKAAAPSATVYVVGYPDLVPPHPSAAANAVTCISSGLVLGSLGWLAPKQAALQQVIENAASTAGVFWVDPDKSGASYSFASHTVCAADSWFIRPLNRHPTVFSFHPTSVGQSELAQAFLANGVVTGATNPPASGISPERDKGAPLAINSDLGITTVTTTATTETVHISGSGFRPGSQVGVGVHDAGDIGTVSADQSGKVDQTITFPSNGASGVALTGVTPSGAAALEFGAL